MTGSKEFLAHKAWRLYHERKFTLRQVAQSLDIGLATANKYIHLADEAKEQDDLAKLANLCKGKPFFCGDSHVLGQCQLCFCGIIKEPLDRYDKPTLVRNQVRVFCAVIKVVFGLYCTISKAYTVSF